MNVDIKQKITELKDHLQNKMKEADEKTLYYIFGGVLLSIFLLDYFILMGPQLKTLTKTTPEIKLLENDILNTNEDLRKIALYTKQVDEYKKKVFAANEKVNSREQVPLILEVISRIADKNGVRVDSIMPNMEAQQNILENDEQIFYLLPVKIEAKAGYHNFGRFISQLESNDIYFRVGNFNFESSENSNLHPLNLTLETIVYERK